MSHNRYPSDLTEEEWALVEPVLPPPKPGGRPRTTDLREVINGLFYLLRTGTQWRYLPKEFPPWSTVHSYFRIWKRTGLWWKIYRTLYPQARVLAGRNEQPSAAVMDSQSVKTTEKGAFAALMRTRKCQAGSAASSWTRRASCCRAGSNQQTSKTGVWLMIFLPA